MTQGWQGPGGPFGWGGVALPPPPPQPGVIPLAPLRLAEVLGGAFATFGRFWKPLVGLVATVYGVLLAAGGVALAVAFALVSRHVDRLRHLDGAHAETADVRPVVIAASVVLVIGAVVLLAGQSVLQAACAVCVQEGVLGRRVTYRAALRRSLARFRAVLGALVLAGLVTGLPPLALAGLVARLAAALTSGIDSPWPAAAAFLAMLVSTPYMLWLWIRYCLASTVAVAEGCGPVTALRRSAALVRDGWWRILGIFLLATVCATVVSDIITGVIEVAGVLGTLNFTLTDPGSSHAVVYVLVPVFLVLWLCEVMVMLFPQLVVALLYVDQRMRKEDLARALAAAA